MSTLRTLPPKPSLEFEHKAAKSLLRQFRAGNPDAIARARARHPAIKASPQLADAQLVIAREYGFTSWPRLVRYFNDAERQRESPYLIQSVRREDYEPRVGWLIAGHQARRVEYGRALAAFVPRFYGMRLTEIFDSAVTEDDARLAVARKAGFSSWGDLVDRTTMGVAPIIQEPEDSPFRAAGRAMEALDLDLLQRLVVEHPELLHPPAHEAARGKNLLNMALGREERHGRWALRAIMEWLATLGLDLQRELNSQLRGRIKMPTERVRYLLERGADPNWVAPNGVPVLEHALIRYWNAEAVDLLAARARPRKALWIAAGLGDVDGIRQFLDREGRPTAEARLLRPPFDLVGPMMSSHPDPDDDEILMEAFVVAMFNGRTAVLEYLASRGAPVNSLVFQNPMIAVAVGNAMTSVVECLVRCGADLDLRGWKPSQSAREIAREMLQQLPEDQDRRRIVELCGMDPVAVLAERRARPEAQSE